MERIAEVGRRVWIQANAELAVPCVLQSLKRLKYLVSIVNCPWCFVAPSLHVNSVQWEGALHTVQLVF